MKACDFKKEANFSWLRNSSIFLIALNRSFNSSLSLVYFYNHIIFSLLPQTHTKSHTINAQDPSFYKDLFFLFWEHAAKTSLLIFSILLSNCPLSLLGLWWKYSWWCKKNWGEKTPTKTMESEGLAENTSRICRPVHTDCLSTLNISTYELGAGLP